MPQACRACGNVARVRDSIGGYRLAEPLARGGMGMIFRATDAAGGALAVKLLQPPFAATSADIDYFASEVWSLARLNHPNCLRIFAAGVEEGVVWIAMEWHSRGSLAARLAERGRLREAEVLAIGIQVATALGAAAAAGHPHRDIEPNNLVFADTHVVKVTDFGQAALYQIAADDLGSMWGRTSYVPPERLRAEPEEAYSDIYSLGAVLYHALVGVPVHGGEPGGLAKLALLEAGDICIEKEVAGLHDKTIETLNRMLASEPADRFQHWGEVVTHLTQAGTMVARREAAAAPARAAAKAAAAARPARSKQGPRPRVSPWIVAVMLLAMLILALVAGLAVNRLGWSLSGVATPVPATPSPLR